MRLKVALLTLTIGVAVFFAAPAWAQDEKPKICLYKVSGTVGINQLKKLRRALHLAFSQREEFQTITVNAYRRMARRLRISKRKRTNLAAFKKIAKILALDYGLTARIVRQGRGFNLVLRAIGTQKGNELFREVHSLPGPRLSSAKAKVIVDSFGQSLLAKEVDTQSDQAETEALGLSLDLGKDDAAVQTPDGQEETGISTAEDAAWASAAEDWGDDSAAAGDAGTVETSTSDLRLELSGRMAVENHTYFKELPGNKIPGRNSVDLALQAKAGADNIQATGTFLIRQDFSDQQRDRLEAEEVTIGYTQENFSFNVGKTTVSWGSASMMNPTDIINHRDMRDLIDTEKLGSWMLRLGWILGPVLAEVFYLPVPDAHLLPLANELDAEGIPTSRSRWFLDVFPRAAPGDPAIVYQIGTAELPNATLKNGQLAFRLATSFTGFDLSIGYGYMFDRLPTLHQEVTPPSAEQAYVNIDLSMDYQRLHMFTADLESVVGKFRFAAEALVVLTRDLDDADPEIDNPYASMVLGVDVRTGQFNDDHDLHFFLEFGYTRSLVGELISTPLSLLRHPFELAAFGRVRYEWGQDLNLDLNLISQLERIDIIINPEIEWILFDKLTAKLGFLYLYGSGDDSLLAHFKDNMRITALLELVF